MALQFLEWFNGIILKSFRVSLSLSLVLVGNLKSEHGERLWDDDDMTMNARVVGGWAQPPLFIIQVHIVGEIISAWNIPHRNYESLRLLLGMMAFTAQFYFFFALFSCLFLYAFAGVLKTLHDSRSMETRQHSDEHTVGDVISKMNERNLWSRACMRCSTVWWIRRLTMWKKELFDI